MNRILFIVFLALAGHAGASGIGLEFKDIPVNQFTQSVIKGLLNQDYVITPEAAGVESKISLSVHGLDRDGVKATLNDVLNSVGLQLSERRNVLYVEKRGMAVVVDRPGDQGASAANVLAPGKISAFTEATPYSDEEAQVYFPKYRGADYLGLAVKAAGARLIEQSSQSGTVNTYGQGSTISGFPQTQHVAHTNQRPGGSKDVLVFTGRPEAINKASKLLIQLDRPSVAVELRGAVLEVSDSSESLRSFSAVLNLLGGKIGIAIDAGRHVGNSVAVRGANLNAILSAVDGDSRFRYLSEPTMRVVEGETARLTVGQDVPVRGAIQTDKNGNQLQSIEYRTAGHVIEVTPTVFENMVRLKIGQQLSSFTTTTTSGIDSPTMLKREAATVVQAEDGELIAIAGLDESRENMNRSGLFFLPSFMQSKNNTRQRSQILLLLEVKKIGSAI